MTAITETLLLSTLLFAYCVLIFLPPGLAILKIWPGLKFPITIRLCVSIGFGVLVISGGFLLAYFTCRVIGINTQFAGYMVLLLSIVSLLWIDTGTLEQLQNFCRELFVPMVVLFLAYLLLVFISAFPNGNWRDISTETTMALTSLPIDAQIPFNFSRYLLEEIPLNSIDVVPGWSAFDRTPLAAIVFSAVASSLHLHDSSPWLGLSSYVYFPFQAVLALLNLLPIFAVWAIAEMYFGKQTASLSLLVLISSQFFFNSALLTWPKLFAAYFVLMSVILGLSYGRWGLAGIFAGAAILSHDYALFVSSVIAIFSLLTIGKDPAQKFDRVISFLTYIACAVICVAPWYIVRAVYAEHGSRMLALYISCNAEGSNLPMLVQFKNYISSHSLMDILSIRLSNIVYPFSVTPLFGLIAEWNFNLIAILQNAHGLTFFRALFANGLLFAVIFITAVPKYLLKYKTFGKLVLVTLSALLPYVAVVGCRDFSVSHVWAYPFTCLAAIIIANEIIRSCNAYNKVFAWLVATFAGVGFALNIFQIFLYLWFVSSVRPFIHASYAFNAAVVTLVVSLVFVIIFSVLNSRTCDEVTN